METNNPLRNLINEDNLKRQQEQQQRDELIQNHENKRKAAFDLYGQIAKVLEAGVIEVRKVLGDINGRIDPAQVYSESHVIRAYTINLRNQKVQFRLTIQPSDNPTIELVMEQSKITFNSSKKHNANFKKEEFTKDTILEFVAEGLKVLGVMG